MPTHTKRITIAIVILLSAFCPVLLAANSGLDRDAFAIDAQPPSAGRQKLSWPGEQQPAEMIARAFWEDDPPATVVRNEPGEMEPPVPQVDTASAPYTALPVARPDSCLPLTVYGHGTMAMTGETADSCSWQGILLDEPPHLPASTARAVQAEELAPLATSCASMTPPLECDVILAGLDTKGQTDGGTPVQPVVTGNTSVDLLPVAAPLWSSESTEQTNTATWQQAAMKAATPPGVWTVWMPLPEPLAVAGTSLSWVAAGQSRHSSVDLRAAGVPADGGRVPEPDDDSLTATDTQAQTPTAPALLTGALPPQAAFRAPATGGQTDEHAGGSGSPDHVLPASGATFSKNPTAVPAPIRPPEKNAGGQADDAVGYATEDETDATAASPTQRVVAQGRLHANVLSPEAMTRMAALGLRAAQPTARLVLAGGIGQDAAVTGGRRHHRMEALPSDPALGPRQRQACHGQPCFADPHSNREDVLAGGRPQVTPDKRP